MPPPSEGPISLRILLLEDSEDDAALMLRELRKAGLGSDTRWVRDQEEYLAALAEPFDVVLSDYRLPGYGGLAAYNDLHLRHPDTPFIVLSGTLGDERAAECIKQGVTDYLLKDRLGRLGLAIRSAVRSAGMRSEARRVEEQLRQSQKMEAVGKLAGGIAHDFNNLLTAINGWIELLLDTEPLPPRVVKVLGEIGLAGDRAMRLTQQLLLFSRKRPLQHEPVDLNATVKHIAAMLRQVIGEDVHLDFALEEDLPPVEGDAGSLEQVLVNLAVNARDAMPDGGHLHIATERVGARGGDYLRLSVRDEGCGIPADIQPHIFEPFFTTKEPGKGTGIGLSTAFGIVQQHRGWIEVESRVGTGTTFHIFLPLAEGAPPAPAAAGRGGAAKDGASATILVVEDEQTVRKLAVTALTLRGYRVLAAGTGREALKIWKGERAAIDAVLTDIVMPDRMSGLELAQVLRTEKPAVPIIFTSGYNEEVVRRGFVPPENSRFLAKPYTVKTLAGVIAELLQPPAADRVDTVRARR